MITALQFEEPFCACFRHNIAAPKEQIPQHQNKYLYLRGSCLRIRTTEEMAYRPISSVMMSTMTVPEPAPDTAKNSCTRVDKYCIVYDAAISCAHDQAML